MSERAQKIAAQLLEEAHVDPATPVVVPPSSVDFFPVYEVIGQEYRPPHVNVDADTELAMAEKSGFTAWELADRRGVNHPRLLKAVTGTPYEPLYRRRFKLPQQDKFYSNESKKRWRSWLDSHQQPAA